MPQINGFQVDSICALLFRRILPSLQCTQLMELLQELDQHVYCRLDRSYEDAVGRMEVGRGHLRPMLCALQAPLPLHACALSCPTTTARGIRPYLLPPTSPELLLPAGGPGALLCGDRPQGAAAGEGEGAV